jgi:hypothetical protein
MRMRKERRRKGEGSGGDEERVSAEEYDGRVTGSDRK